MCCDIPHLGGFVRILNATGSGNPVSLPPPQPMTTITLHLCTALENNHQLLHIYHHFQPFRQARKACRRFRQYGLHVSSTLAFLFACMFISFPGHFIISLEKACLASPAEDPALQTRIAGSAALLSQRCSCHATHPA